MQNEQASRTAIIIAASLVVLYHGPKYRGLVAKSSSDFCEQMLSDCSSRTRLFVKIIRQDWFRGVAKLIERITIPGILLHYALRKKCVRALATSALVNGATQVVIIGAGFDPLGLELHRDFSSARIWEIDHPATQRCKMRSFSPIDARFHFVADDLSATGLDEEALIQSGFNPSQRTFWLAEGLLMYLRSDKVLSLIKTVSRLSASGSRFAFTFMETQCDGRIRFDSQTKLIDWWLRTRGEPFLWGATRGELIDLVRPWRITRFFDHHDLSELQAGVADRSVARGEVICLAEI